jgi:hypothetical protein
VSLLSITSEKDVKLVFATCMSPFFLEFGEKDTPTSGFKRWRKSVQRHSTWSLAREAVSPLEKVQLF